MVEDGSNHAQVCGGGRGEPGVRPLCERGRRCQGRPLSHHVLQVRKKRLEKKKILTKMCSRLFTLIVARINEAIKVIHFPWHLGCL